MLREWIGRLRGEAGDPYDKDTPQAYINYQRRNKKNQRNGDCSQ